MSALSDPISETILVDAIAVGEKIIEALVATFGASTVQAMVNKQMAAAEAAADAAADAKFGPPPPPPTKPELP